MPLQELVMRMFDVQGIEIVATRAKVFEFLKEPGNLPQWAHAFVSAEEGRARLETPAGAVDVGLDVSADADASKCHGSNAPPESRSPFQHRQQPPNEDGAAAAAAAAASTATSPTGARTDDAPTATGVGPRIR